MDEGSPTNLDLGPMRPFLCPNPYSVLKVRVQTVVNKYTGVRSVLERSGPKNRYIISKPDLTTKSLVLGHVVHGQWSH